MRTDRLVPPFVILGLTGLVAVLVSMAPASPLRTATTVLFFLVAPGLAVVPLLGVRDGFARYALVLAVSIAADMVVAEAMLYAGVWSPRLGMTVLTGLSVAGALTQVAMVSRHAAQPRASVTAERLLAQAAGFLIRPIDSDRLREALAQLGCQQPGPVVVAEPDGARRAELRQLLRAQGWAVADAADSAGALQFVTAVQPAVILFDYALHREHELDFTRELTAHANGREIPILITTSARTAFLAASAKASHERRLPAESELRRRLLNSPARGWFHRIVTPRVGDA